MLWFSKLPLLTSMTVIHTNITVVDNFTVITNSTDAYVSVVLSASLLVLPQICRDLDSVFRAMMFDWRFWHNWHVRQAANKNSQALILGQSNWVLERADVSWSLVANVKAEVDIFLSHDMKQRQISGKGTLCVGIGKEEGRKEHRWNATSWYRLKLILLPTVEVRMTEGMAKQVIAEFIILRRQFEGELVGRSVARRKFPHVFLWKFF